MISGEQIRSIFHNTDALESFLWIVIINEVWLSMFSEKDGFGSGDWGLFIRVVHKCYSNFIFSLCSRRRFNFFGIWQIFDLILIFKLLSDFFLFEKALLVQQLNLILESLLLIRLSEYWGLLGIATVRFPYF